MIDFERSKCFNANCYRQLCSNCFQKCLHLLKHTKRSNPKFHIRVSMMKTVKLHCRICTKDY